MDVIRRSVVLLVGLALAVTVARPAVSAPGEGVLGRIRSAFGDRFVNLDELVGAMRTLGFGWGEVIMALYLSTVSGKPVDDIIHTRTSGKGWGQIARELGVSSSQVGLAVASVMSEGRLPEAAGKPEPRSERPSPEPQTAAPGRAGGPSGGSGAGGHGRR